MNMRHPIFWAAAFALVTLSGGAKLRAEGTVTLPLGGPGAPWLATQSVRKTWMDLKYAGIIRQRYDYSCGAAALALLHSTLLEDPLTEEQVLERVLAGVPPEARAARLAMGLSLLDMQNLARARGHRAGAYWLDLEQLKRLPHPVIAFVSPETDQPHFTLIKAFDGRKAWLADSSLGHARKPAYEFARWFIRPEKGKGIVLALQRADGSWVNHPVLAAAEPMAEPELIQASRNLAPALRALQLPQ
jgi:predicted double-glycine peptidase